ncbi:SnoaL-like protein [Diaminobutyricimonas aerilata]|uniref:SnoaL-like protein n=1 Tax=Diaminobutyricimonas aerilata TaxID=1162967 RepID=A0A2M9CM52_9MICO|nr:nuclear transport factor 2 family protein [Diaminobutyricimonas aerilata]PJJ72987.1 SnoaL-like protein [Diaminobutyricimonas aerilata]
MASLDALMRANLLEVFGERDADRRLDAIRRTYTDDVVFADAEGGVEGHDALNAKAQSILDGAPGFVFRPAGDAYEIQDMGYLAWEFGPEGADPVVRGADMGFVRDGALAKVYTVLFH